MKRRIICLLLCLLMAISPISMVFAANVNTVSEESSGGEVTNPPDGGDVTPPDGGETPPDGGETPPGGGEVTPPPPAYNPISINSFDYDNEVKVGQSASFSVSASGDDISYSWEVRMPGGSYAQKGTGSSFTLNITNDSFDGAKVRCKVYNSKEEKYTIEVTLTVLVEDEIIKITTHPKNTSADTGSKFTLTAEATSNKGEVKYQWYYQKPGESAWRIPSGEGVSSNKLTMVADETLNGAIFRCKVKGVEGSEVYTNNATVTVENKIKILEQPESKVIAQVGMPLNLVVTASGESLSYYWYYKEPKGTDWVSTGVKSNSITIQKVTPEMNGRVYRCKVYSSVGEVFTNEILISVLTAAPKITKQPEVLNFVVIGEWLELAIEAEGEDIKYNWEYKLINSDKWESANNKTKKYAVEITDMTYNGAQFRCSLSNEGGETVSNIYEIVVTEAPIEPCPNDAHVFSLWNVSSPATEAVTGLADRVCEICGTKETKSIPAGTPADADLDKVFSGEYVPPTDDDKENKPLNINWSIVAIIAMAGFAAVLIVVLYLKTRGNEDDDDFDDDPDEKAVDETENAQENNMSDTLVAGSIGAEAAQSVNEEAASDIEEEIDIDSDEVASTVTGPVTQVISADEIAEEAKSDAQNEDGLFTDDEETPITRVIPVSELEKLLNDNKQNTEE